MQVILIKDACEIALQGKENKSEGMTEKNFEKNDRMTMAIGKPIFRIERFGAIQYGDSDYRKRQLGIN